MGKRVNRKKALANPVELNPFSADKGLLRVVIETPKGSRNKFAFNEDERIFELKKGLPPGMAFPYDFGFVPSTKADDGDPVDRRPSPPHARARSVLLAKANFPAFIWILSNPKA